MTKNKLYLKAPKGVKVKRHTFGNVVRFTTPSDGFHKLIAVAKNDKFTWICRGFSS